MINKSSAFLLTLVVSVFLWCVSETRAATFYVDSAAKGNKTGADWANAWTALSQITQVNAGDTVQISKGTYTVSDWRPAGGNSSGGRITYQISRESGHSGIATFNCNGTFLAGAAKYITVSGDGGDGAQHFVVTGITGRVVDGSQADNYRVAYIRCDHSTGSLGYFNGGTNLEVDHCYFYKDAGSNSNIDNIFYFDVQGDAWDVNSIHDCVMYTPRNTSGGGDDTIQGSCNGTDVYNNTFIGYSVATYPRGQHQDGIQPLHTQYLRVYDNYFEDIANYPIFGDAYYGDMIHFWVYNNVIVLTNAQIQASAPPQGIAIGPDGGAFNNLGRYPKFTDCLVANNLVVDYGNHNAANLRNNAGQSSVFSGCVMKNNLSIASGPFGFDPAVAASNNLHNPPPSGLFVKYVALTAGNDFHLLASASVLRGKGDNLSSYFKTDKDGVARPLSGAWDIGPYQYGGGSGPTPTVTPTATPAPTVTPSPEPTATPAPTPTPAAKFKVGDHVETISATTNIRSTPSGTVLGTQSDGAQGSIMDGPQAADLYGETVIWYDVNFGSGPDGWCGDDNLELASSPAPTPTPGPTATPSPTPPPSGQTWEKWIEKQNDWIRGNPPTPDK